MIFLLVFGLPTEPAVTLFEEISPSKPFYFKWQGNSATWNEIFKRMYDHFMFPYKQPSAFRKVLQEPLPSPEFAIDPGWGERPLASPNPLQFFPSGIPRPPPSPLNEFLLVPSPSPTSEDGLLRLWLQRGSVPNLMKLENDLLVVAGKLSIESWPSCDFWIENYQVVCTGLHLCEIWKFWKFFKPRSKFKFLWSDCEFQRLPL